MSSIEISVNKIIRTSIITTSTVGFFDPTPGGFDVPVIIATWANMVYKIGKFHDVEMEESNLSRMFGQAILTMALFKGGTSALIFLLKITGAGWLLGGSINATLNGLYTFLLGKSLDNNFRKRKEPLTSEETMRLFTKIATFGLSEVSDFAKFMMNDTII